MRRLLGSHVKVAGDAADRATGFGDVGAGALP